MAQQSAAESAAAASYGRLASRPKVGFDLGKDSGCKVLTRLWSVDIDVLGVRCGVHAATFLRFTKMLTMLLFYLCLFLLPALLYYFDRGDGERKGYSSATLQALGSKDDHYWWLMAGTVAAVCFVATVFINQFTRHVRLTYLLGRTKAPVSNFAVHLTEWPITACRDKDQQKLYKEFDRQYKGEVVAVHIIPDVGAIMDLELERDNAVDALEHYQAVPGNPTCREAPIFMLGATVDAVKHWKQRVAQLDAQLASARRDFESQPRGTGHVFVTFNEIRAARAALSALAAKSFSLEFKYTGPNEGKVARVDPASLSVEIAPNPDDIQWRNLGLPGGGKVHFFATDFFFFFFFCDIAWCLSFLIPVRTPSLFSSFLFFSIIIILWFFSPPIQAPVGCPRPLQRLVALVFATVATGLLVLPIIMLAAAPTLAASKSGRALVGKADSLSWLAQFFVFGYGPSVAMYIATAVLADVFGVVSAPPRFFFFFFFII
jgi:hypothetical protein